MWPNLGIPAKECVLIDRGVLYFRGLHKANLFTSLPRSVSNDLEARNLIPVSTELEASCCLPSKTILDANFNDCIIMTLL